MKLDVMQHIVVFILEIRLWSGRKKLRPQDLAANGIEPDKLPPGSLASLGSKKIIHSEALGEFVAIKREAQNLCLEKGVRFLGGYAVPADQAQPIAAKLCALQRRFETAKSALLLDYDAKLHRWIDENPPQWASVIKAAAEPVSHVQKALSFGYTPVSLSPPTDLDTPQSLNDRAQGLYGQLCHEVRTMAQQAFENSYLGRTQVTRKALRPISAIRDKLCALGFLDPQIQTLVQTIDATLRSLPATGPIEGEDLGRLVSLVRQKLCTLGLATVPSEEQGLLEQKSRAAQDLVDGGGLQQVEQLDLPMAAAAEEQSPAPRLALSWDF